MEINNSENIGNEHNEEINNYENNNNQIEYKNQENQNYNEEEEEINEDEYLMELQHRLTKMKRERKEAEQNAKLLDNHLNMIKKEEDKQWKKFKVKNVLQMKR